MLSRHASPAERLASPAGAHRLEQGAALLACNHFGAAYGPRVVLANVSFEVEAGSITVLMGPGGTGKSTLLRSLAGLNDSNPRFRHWGQVIHAGQAYPFAKPPRLVQQHARLLQSSVLEVLSDAARQCGVPHKDQHAHVVQRIEALGLGELVPLLHRATVDVPVVMQRVVAIASVALLEPSMIMLDEPTFGLGDYDAHVVCELIRAIAGSATVLVSMHHQRQARSIGTQVLLLAGGVIQAAAPVDEFFDQPQGPVAQQFVRTGSCSVPSPNADPAELSEDAPAPASLPQAAVCTVPAVSLVASDGAAPATSHAAVEPVRDRLPVLPQPSTAEEVLAAQCLTQRLTEQARQQTRVAQPAVAAAAPRRRRPVNKLLNAGAGLALARQIVTQSQPVSRAPRGFSWVVPGRLAGTPMPGAVANIDYDLAALKSVGITMLITLTERDVSQEALRSHGLRNLHLPVRDGEPPTVAQTHMLLIRMQALLDRGESLAVHCLAGIGRTGTVLAAWLIREGGLSAEEALTRLRRIDPSYVQTEEQEGFLRKYENSFLHELE